MRRDRGRAWRVLALLLVGLLASLTARADEPKTVRIGYQKYGTLVLLKARGTLEDRLRALGFQVRWIEFPGGPQLLEALNVGAIDFGTTGEAPPIFAQAAGAPLLYVGYEPPAPHGEAVVVPKDSPIRRVEDLRGKRVALNKGSNVHYLLVRVLERAGLSIKDIEPVYLPPAEARAAFDSGAVAAWAIWDPFFAAVEQATGARILSDGEGLVANHQFFLAAKPFAESSAPAVAAILDEVDRTDRWAKSEPDAAAALLAPGLGLPAAVVATALGRMGYGVASPNDAVVAQQQKIADTFKELGLIPRTIRVRDAIPRSGS